MAIEDSVAALTTATTALITAVGTQQTAVANAVAAFTATTARVTALARVNNTNDLEKVVSTLTTAALALKQDLLVSGTNISTVNGLSLLSGLPLVIARSATSLTTISYDNRGTMRALTPQVDDAIMVDGLGLFMYVGSQLEPDDDETCFNTSAGQWLIKAAFFDLIDAWNSHDTQYNDDWREDEAIRFATFLTPTTTS